MPLPVTRRVFVLTAAVLLLALSFAPRVASALANEPAGRAGGSSELLFAGSASEAAPAVARFDQGGIGIDRAFKHGLTLVVVITALLMLPVLVQRASRATERHERVGLAAPSPFGERAPPQRTALCT
jgi:hypothetical protein